MSDGTQIKVVDPYHFPLLKLQKLKYVKRPKRTPKDKPNIINIITAFDIETTRIPEINQSVMYTWQWHFHKPINVCVVGRTWMDFMAFTEMLQHFLPEGQLIVYDHNLSYEFQFLRAFYDFQNDEVFAVQSRKVLYCTMYNNRFMFRDSMLQTNMSLKQFLKKMHVQHQKVSGIDFNYDKSRYAWTELNDLEMKYITNDVIGLCEAIETEMESDGDNLYTIPLTSTGYVRRDAKKALFMDAKFGNIPDMLPDWKTYTLLREAFRGGDCHCNRYIAGDILYHVHSYDRSSSYPDVLCNCDFPMAAFKDVGSVDQDQVAKMVNDHIPFVCRCHFVNIRLRNKYYPLPYLPVSKCTHVQKPKIDNGCILSADALQTTITDIDFQIILEVYDFDDLYIPVCMTSKYRPLPYKFIQVITDYYKLKTKLKGDPSADIYYTKLKNKLNALYGMCAQDPVKESILFDGGAWNTDTKPRMQLLEEYQNHAFLPYQWGVWCTAWARYRLYEGVKIAGPENFVYCDTDSVKFTGSDADYSAFNRRAERWSRESGAVGMDAKGNMHFMGVFEREHDYYRFRAWGAKKYAYQYEENGPTEATISGVVKVSEYDNKGEPVKLSGGLELDKHGGLEAFEDGFVFREAGGLDPIYNDDNYGKYTIEGHEIEITSNVCLVPSTYTVHLTNEYKELIDQSDIEILKRLGLPGYQES